MMIEGSGSVSGSVPRTSGSGFGSRCQKAYGSGSATLYRAQQDCFQRVQRPVQALQGRPAGGRQGFRCRVCPQCLHDSQYYRQGGPHSTFHSGKKEFEKGPLFYIIFHVNVPVCKCLLLVSTAFPVVYRMAKQQNLRHLLVLAS
jgi:hypothetical protein